MTPAGKQHQYSVQVEWTGNTGSGTSGYRSYKRDHQISAGEKRIIEGSSDPGFRGDAGRYNPEELLVASLSACHMLWYLHLCAEASIVVTEYRDEAAGTMVETADGGGRFSAVVLRPAVTVSPESDTELAMQLHEKAHALCFRRFVLRRRKGIANSINFPLSCEPSVNRV